MKSTFSSFRSLLAAALFGAALFAGACSILPKARGPRAELLPVAAMNFPGAKPSDPSKPGETDCNSPAHWDHGRFYIFNSAGHPWRSSGSDLFHLHEKFLRVEYNNQTNGGRWIEATWKDKRGPLYGWYHFEPTGLCPGTRLTAPLIGAARSVDNGAHWEDLGVILSAPPGALRCDTKNFYFAGGNGDFSVMLDPPQQYLYFFISTYAGSLAEQGVAVARINWKDRDAPVGKVWKWQRGSWSQPGLGGLVTAIFPAMIDWHRADANAFWGPSIHWNSYLHQYVLFLNRAADSNWKQEGIYLSFNRDISNPATWSPPQKILGALRADEWYPQVIGLNFAQHETDKAAGQKARLFVRGQSRWELRFRR